MRFVKHRPSPAMIVALLALFVALGGVGVAATGGNFILGQSNTAGSTTGLNSGVTTGPTLSLVNTGNKPAARFTTNSGVAPFSVDRPTRIASLNADLLDNYDSGYFLPKTGTAADASKLGGKLPSYYLPAADKAADSDKLDGLDSTSFAASAQEGWHEVGAPGEPPWSYDCSDACPVYHFANFGGGYNTAGFYRDSIGRVHLKGLVALQTGRSATCDANSGSIFVLPVGYRPAATEIAATVHNDTLSLGRIDIRSDGAVTICTTSSSSAGEWWALDGISFRAA